MRFRNIYYSLMILALSLLTGLCQSMYADDAKGLKFKTIVIDPGHGGKDAGCVSKDKKTYEKNISLTVSKALKKKINEAFPDVKVILTRSKDEYITLNERADIANRNNADLFVSIHVNSVVNTRPHGFSCHILGQSSVKNRDLFSLNMELCKRENSVILLEEDYTTKYQGFDPSDPESFIFFTLMQNAHYEQSLLFAAECDNQMSKGPISHSRGISQDPFYVLWKSAMPSVLIEIGFISNASDLSVMKTDKGCDEIATALFNAFREFKKKYDNSISTAGEINNNKVITQEKTISSEGVVYGMQVLVSSRDLSTDDKMFKGFKCFKFKVGDLYKYILGASNNENEARQESKRVKEQFPDAFFVKVNPNK